MLEKDFDVIVVGGGHAGIEAAAAAARMGCHTLLVTLQLDKLGELSCNPAIGGVGKGQLVKEIDALGGLMAELADQACIQYRQLNTNRGAAARSTRMQVDREEYRALAQAALKQIPGLELCEDEVKELILEQATIKGACLAKRGEIKTRAVVLTPGTFFHGLIHIGPEQIPGGRIHDPGSDALPQWLQQRGLLLGRFKTGTTPRLLGSTIAFSRLEEQAGDPEYIPFSSRSEPRFRLPQRSCYIGHTTEKTHTLIRQNLQLSALYSGRITATGVRYCPSVEDKVVKFPDRESHHVFVEPEGLNTGLYYPNGLSNSLPLSVQQDLVHSVPGLEQAEIVQPGYGIEYDFLDPTQLKPNLEAKPISGLFFAGQINGTTGYEEAAAQGLIAGINASRRVHQQPPIIIDRSQAYIGVLIDDLVTKGTNEPYRMFTSRVEYRLVVREDNADDRLTALGHELGLISEQAYAQYLQQRATRQKEEQRLSRQRLPIGMVQPQTLAAWGISPWEGAITLQELLRRPEIDYAHLAQLDPLTAQVPRSISRRVEVEVKYEGYIQREAIEIEKFKSRETFSIPEAFTYAGLPGLSLEIIEKLSQIRPRNLGQASRISGVTPAAITLLMMYIKKRHT